MTKNIPAVLSWRRPVIGLPSTEVDSDRPSPTLRQLWRSDLRKFFLDFSHETFPQNRVQRRPVSRVLLEKAADQVAKVVRVFDWNRRVSSSDYL